LDRQWLSIYGKTSTRLAWERLDPALRKRLENSFGWHDYVHSRGKIAPDLASPEERAALPPQCWRMAWKNPANGRTALYVASHAYAIEGMEQQFLHFAALSGEISAREAAKPRGQSCLTRQIFQTHPWPSPDACD
jgi:hypothetical protein